jgi:hypothetical protein
VGRPLRAVPDREDDTREVTYYTTAEVAEFTRMSPQWVRKMCASGGLPHRYFGEGHNRQLRIPHRPLRDWLDALPDHPEAAGAPLRRATRE